MILIIDSGATKSECILTNNHGSIIKHFFIEGLNPNYKEKQEIYETINNNFNINEQNEIRYLFFYGAGCSSEKNKNIIKDVFSNFNPKIKVYVEPDILGTARALFKNNEGIACILGTGSNIALYDGNSIKYSPISLGFILGDFGSGCDLGKRLIYAILTKEINETLCQKFYQEFNLSDNLIIENIYQKKQPNKFLASFANFIKENEHYPEIKQIINSSFTDFFEKSLSKIPFSNSYQIAFSGSIAYYFQDYINKIASNYDYKILNFKKNIGLDLIDYHIKQSHSK